MFLLSEIEINRVNENEKIILDKILRNIQSEGFETVNTYRLAVKYGCHEINLL